MKYNEPIFEEAKQKGKSATPSSVEPSWCHIVRYHREVTDINSLFVLSPLYDAARLHAQSWSVSSLNVLIGYRRRDTSRRFAWLAEKEWLVPAHPT